MGVLDIRTLSLTLVLFCGLYAVGLGLASIGQERGRALRLCAASVAAEGIGFLLLGLREYIPTLVSVLVANLLIFIGMALTLLAAESFLERRLLPRWGLVLLVLALVSLFYHFTFVDTNVNVRIVFISLWLGGLSLATAWAFLRSAELRRLLSMQMSVAVFLAFGGFMLMRAVWTLFEATIPDFMQAGAIHVLAFLAYLMLVSGKAFAFVWMENQRNTERLRMLARVDSLTGVLNRRTLFEELERELKRSLRHDRSLSLVMLDIDHFKAINDRHGHLCGDQALVRLSACLRRGLREIDLIGRFGGEEFIVVLPDVDCDTAAGVVERLRSALASEPIASAKGAFNVTASFGIAALGLHGKDPDALVTAADGALYRAKQGGRNRAEIAEAPKVPPARAIHSP